MFQDKVTRYVQEETFFSCLSKLVPSLALHFLAVLMWENITLNVPVIYSCCTKTSINWEGLCNSYKMRPVWMIIMSFIGLGMQISILVKLKQVESHPPNHPWVISFNTRDGDPGVNIARLPSPTSHCRVFRHRRNVVSPLGSCVSSTVSQIWVIIVAYYIYSASPAGPPMAYSLLLFMAPSRDFFLLNLIETICSPTLRNRLFDLTQYRPI